MENDNTTLTSAFQEVANRTKQAMNGAAINVEDVSRIADAAAMLARTSGEANHADCCPYCQKKNWRGKATAKIIVCRICHRPAAKVPVS